MHPVVEPAGVEQEFRRFKELSVAAIHEGIEHSDFGIREGIQCQDLFVTGGVSASSTSTRMRTRDWPHAVASR